MATDEGDSSSSCSGILLKQTLMSHKECFVYKVPPLATASGYRANDWNLEAPLETCGFQVERRNNDLYLLFTLENHTKLFALSKIEGEGKSINSINVETVMDSSRYFVCKILQSNPNAKDATKNKSNARTALLGFGFRERDIAIDVLANLQQFRQSIDREIKSKDLAAKTKAIPTLAEGEKLHIRIPGGSGKSTTVKSTKSSGGSTPIMLLKKPPPGADEVSPDGPMSPFSGTKRFSMSHMECPLMSKTLNIGSNHGKIDEGTEGSGNGHNDNSKDDDDDNNSEAAQAHTVVDDLLSVDDDFDGPSGGYTAGTSVDDDESEGAVGGGTVADDDSTADSFQFSDLDLDDLDLNKKNDDENNDGAAAAGVAAATATSDDDFGDFQAA